MKFRQLLAEQLDIPKKKHTLLPSGYQRIGDIIILHLEKGLERYEKGIGNFLLKKFKARSVFKKGPVSGELRIPHLKKIAGNGSVTVHKEHGCLFRIDVTKLMFSKGNVLERGRVQAKEGETVVDMFSGIGYFSLPLAKKTPSCRIVAIEKNPVAVRFLRENIGLNRVKNITVIQGDCRTVELENVADRVIMGYFPGTEQFLGTAFGFLKRKGIVHFHNVYHKEELWEKPLDILKKEGLKNGYKLEKVLYKNIVKGYGPGRYHIVMDVFFRKSGRAI